MQVTMLKAKLHKACVTHSSPRNEGAFAIDGDLLELAGIAEYEQIQVYNTSSGERFASHVVRAEHGSRKVAVGGTAARSVAVGDRLVICTYTGLSNRQVYGFKPLMVYCDEQNFVVGAKNAIPLQIAS
jgi:aspartate 1-decarboxylase